MFKQLNTTSQVAIAIIAKPFLFLVLLLMSFNVSATHFRAGTISWTETSTRVVRFDVVQSWRWSAFGNPALGTNVTIGAFSFGDGSSATLSLSVTAINTAEDYFVGTRTLTKTYAANGTFTAGFSDCCRISTLRDGNNDRSELNLVTVKTNTLNSSPTVNSLPIIPFQVNAVNTVAIPVSDANGHPFTFSVTPISQSGLVTAKPLGLSLSSSGVITWSPTISGLYALSVTISDGIGTSVVDLILNVSANCNGCNNQPPDFQPSVAPTYFVTPGVPFQTTITAIDPDGNNPSIFSGTLPAGSTLSANVNPSTGIATRIFSWTPPANATDAFVCFTTTDGLPNGQYIGQYCMTLIVQNAPVFNSPPTPDDGTAFCVLTNDTFNMTIEAVSVSGENVFIASLIGLPSGATALPNLPTTPSTLASTNISWAPTPADWGPHSATVTATTASGLSSSRSYNFLINSTPVFTNPAPPSSVSPNFSYSFTFMATDADVPFGDELTYLTHGLPSWLNFVDNGDGTATISGTPTCADIGEYDIEISVEDIWHHCGPHVEQTFTLTVANATAPMLTCPDNIIVSNDTNECSALVSFMATATANCGDVVINYSSTSGLPFNVGATTVVVIAGDEDGNTISCSFDITVTDAEIPLAYCPNPITVDNDPGECSAVVTFASPMGYDNCGIASAVQISGISSGNVFPLGITNNVYKVTDVNGLFSTCMFTVNVTGDAGDDDCDGVQNVCDVCPDGDDTVDNNNDGTPDCSQLLAYESYSNAWKCAPNKIQICHDGATLCINKNALPAHFNHGDNIGPCTSCGSENRVTLVESDINFEIIANPVSDQVQIALIGHSENDVFFNVYNTFGHLLTTKHIDHHTHDVNIDVSASDIVNGQYLIQLVSGKTMITKKFVVLK
jgi:hypothetical protein